MGCLHQHWSDNVEVREVGTGLRRHFVAVLEWEADELRNVADALPASDVGATEMREAADVLDRLNDPEDGGL